MMCLAVCGRRGAKFYQLRYLIPRHFSSCRCSTGGTDDDDCWRTRIHPACQSRTTCINEAIRLRPGLAVRFFLFFFSFFAGIDPSSPSRKSDEIGEQREKGPVVLTGQLQSPNWSRKRGPKRLAIISRWFPCCRPKGANEPDRSTFYVLFYFILFSIFRLLYFVPKGFPDR